MAFFSIFIKAIILVTIITEINYLTKAEYTCCAISIHPGQGLSTKIAGIHVFQIIMLFFTAFGLLLIRLN